MTARHRPPSAVTRAITLASTTSLILLGAASFAASPANAVGVCPVVDPITHVVTPAPSNGVNWSECVLTGADLHDADLTGADLDDADLSRAILSHANLPGANLTSVLLVDADLTGANLNAADLTGADLTRASLSLAGLTGANLTGAVLSGAHATSAGLSDANLTGARLNAADLTGAGLTGANLTHANLRGTNLTGANLSGANLTGASAQSVNLTNATLMGAVFTGAFMSDAIFTGADLTNSVFFDVALTGATMNGVNIGGVNFSGSSVGTAGVVGTGIIGSPGPLPTGWSFASGVLRSAAAPDAPTMAAVTAGSGQIALSWNAPAVDGDNAITGYQVERSATSSDDGFSIVVPSQIGTTYSDSGLGDGVTRWYRLRAMNGVGTGDFVAASATTTVPTPAPAAPAGGTAAAAPTTGAPAQPATESPAVPVAVPTSLPSAATALIRQQARVTAPANRRFAVGSRVVLSSRAVKTSAGVTVRWRTTASSRGICTVATHGGRTVASLMKVGTCTVVGTAAAPSTAYAVFQATRNYRVR